MTQPSFDITALFNGLQPVIATLSPEEVNTFTANAATFLSGDGTGLEPLLDSIRKLTEFLADRQQVVATLMRNLSELAATMRGHSRDLLQLVEWVNRPLDGALLVLDEFRKAEVTGPGFMAPVVRLLNNAGLTDRADIDLALDRAFTNVDDFVDAVKLVPVMWENIGPPPQVGSPEPCAQGRFGLPAMMDVLVNGQKVVLCNR
jgi:phospholipid/cholesterol/gamma-HCH transport system substrate-binding protein